MTASINSESLQSEAFAGSPEIQLFRENIVEKSIEDRHIVEEKVTKGLGLQPHSLDAHIAVNEASVYIAEATIQSPEASAEQIQDVVEDVVIESAIEIEHGIAPDKTPVRTLILDGYGGNVNDVVANIHETHPLLLSGHEVELFVLQAVDTLRQHPVMGLEPGVVEYPEKNETHESNEQEVALDGKRFVVEQLMKDETSVDGEGMPRPSFMIADQKVVFRNRQEVALFDGVEVRVAAPEYSKPLPVMESVMDEWRPVDTSAAEKFVSTHSQFEQQSTADLLVVTNTVEGMVGAARELAVDPIQAQKLESLLATLSNGEYNSPSSLDAIDGILGAISIDDEGNNAMEYDTDGLAIALAALAGDSDAQSIIDLRRDALRANESKRIQLEQDKNRHDKTDYFKDKEALPLDHMALVHSTQYPVERDTEGNIVLSTAAQKRQDKFPRATLHFTVNSQVESNNGGVWEESNRLIVGNLSRAIDKTQRSPRVLDGVDTWFTLNPGEKVVLPGAIVVESRHEGVLLEESKDSITYLSKETYTDDERHQIDDLLKEVQIHDPQFSARRETIPGTILREIALRKALLAQGVPYEEQDTPSSMEHSMGSLELAERIYKTALEIGAGSGTHFNYPESSFERTAASGMKGDYVGASTAENNMSTQSLSSIEARRQALVSGYTPARPRSETKNIYSVPGGGMVF